MEKLRNKIFQFLYDRKLSQTYRFKCRCIDGCVDCDGTGYILNDLGVALHDLPEAIAEDINGK